MRLLFLSVLILARLAAQTTTVNSNQSVTGRVDDTASASTAPFLLGTILPGTCTLGDMFFKSNAIAGQNMYGCTATNTWTLQAGGSGGGSGTVTSVAATVPSWLAVAGSPITTLGTLALTPATGQTVHQVLGTCGTATSFGPCALVAGDLPASGVHTGDAAGTFPAITLATVNSGSGACGDGTHVCAVVTNAKGLVISQTPTTITAGAGPTSALTDFAPTVSGGTLTVQPGRLRFGALGLCTGLFSGTYTAAIATGTGNGTASLFISDSCALVLQYPNSLTLTWTLSGITVAAVATPGAPPYGSHWLGDVTITTGVLASVVDKRSTINVFSAQAGSGMAIDCTTGPCQFSTDAAVVPTLGGTNVLTGRQVFAEAVRTPASSSATCTAGQFAIDAAYFYNCVATNTWRRVATSSF